MQDVIDELPLLWDGFAVSLQIAAWVIVLGSVAGIFGGLGLLYGPGWLRAALRVYSDILRGLPLIIPIFVVFYVLPNFGIPVSGFAATVMSLSFFAGAHIAEIVRGAVAAVPRGQNDAAKALGLTFWPRTWSIILPQALPAVIPPWTNTAIEMVKGTTLAYLVSVDELLFETYKIAARVGNPLAFYFAAAAMYFVVCFLISRAGALLERRVRFAT